MADEFASLAEIAHEVGVGDGLPSVRRAEVDTVHGRVSAVVWGGEPQFTFLHGAALNAHTWDATVLRLGRSALALDLPGHGDSDCPHPIQDRTRAELRTRESALGPYRRVVEMQVELRNLVKHFRVNAAHEQR
jgi:pimeloyl-ACP methyl ester carboxylesterase